MPHHDDASVHGVRLLVSVVLGWILHDLAFFAASTQPALALALVPGSLVAIVAAGALGALWVRVPALIPTLALASGVASLVAKAFQIGETPVVRWIPRILFVLLATGWLAARLTILLRAHRLERAGEAYVGVGLGALACIATAWVRGGIGFDGPWRVATVTGLAALVLIALATRDAERSRRTATVALSTTLVILLVIAARSETALRRADAAPPPWSGPATGAPNLVLIVLDTVRQDHLAPYGHSRVTTPQLDAFVDAHAVRYANARSSSSWTLPSHASLFTGLQPDEHGAMRPRTANEAGTLTTQAWPARKLRNDVPTLAERLAGEGYQTAAIVANDAFLRHEFGLDRGFERYDDRVSALHPEYAALAQTLGARPRVGFLPYRSAHTISGLALSWLANERRGNPFFLMLNYMDAHSPYIPDASTRGAFSDDQPRNPRKPRRDLHELLYDRELLALDAEVMRVVDALEELGVFENTVVIVTADHGEAFGEHGFHEHGWNLFDEVLRVPLYVKPLGRGGAAVVEQPVPGHEVFEIALEYLGLGGAATGAPPTPSEPSMLGQLYLTKSLLDAWRALGVSTIAPQQLAWLEGDVKFLVRGDGDVTAFDLVQDSAELQPLDLSAGRRAAARARAERWWKDHPEVLTPTPRAEAADLERLRDLGYIGDDPR